MLKFLGMHRRLLPRVGVCKSLINYSKYKRKHINVDFGEIDKRKVSSQLW